MEKQKDILDKTVNSLKNEPVPPGPPQKAVDKVMAKLAEAGDKTQPTTIKEKIKAMRGFSKIAAAAVLLIVAGYAVGRLTAPRPPDVEQLHAALETSLKSSLEPAIRQSLLEDLDHRWQLALANSYVNLKDELNQQFRRDMNQFGVQILTASSTVTNQLLTELIESINAAQTQERSWIVAALEQMELNRLQDRTRLRNDLATFAVRTGDELLRTRQDVAKWIAYGYPESVNLDEPKNSEPSEGKE